MNIAYPQLLSLCLPLVHLLNEMFFIFSYWAKNIHIPEEHCYTDFLSSQILFRNKKRWYKMILEDHLHHMWPRTEINFNFLPPFFSRGAISHTSRARGGCWTQVSWAEAASPVGPAPASIWAASKDFGDFRTTNWSTIIHISDDCVRIKLPVLLK